MYHSWDASSPLDADVVSKDGLESWLAEDAITAFFNSEKAKGSEVEVEEQCRISNEDITCIHSALDPQARERIKLVKSSALVAIQEKTGCSFSPRLVPGDACRPCTESVFLALSAAASCVCRTLGLPFRPRRQFLDFQAVAT